MRVIALQDSVAKNARCHVSWTPYGVPGSVPSVTQTAGLLYRRLPACEPRYVRKPPHRRRPADWQSAIQQTSGLRYSTALRDKKETGTPQHLSPPDKLYFSTPSGCNRTAEKQACAHTRTN